MFTSFCIKYNTIEPRFSAPRYSAKLDIMRTLIQCEKSSVPPTRKSSKLTSIQCEPRFYAKIFRSLRSHYIEVRLYFNLNPIKLRALTHIFPKLKSKNSDFILKIAILIHKITHFLPRNTKTLHFHYLKHTQI